MIAETGSCFGAGLEWLHRTSGGNWDAGLPGHVVGRWAANDGRASPRFCRNGLSTETRPHCADQRRSWVGREPVGEEKKAVARFRRMSPRRVSGGALFAAAGPRLYGGASAFDQETYGVHRG